MSEDEPPTSTGLSVEKLWGAVTMKKVVWGAAAAVGLTIAYVEWARSRKRGKRPPSSNTRFARVRADSSTRRAAKHGKHQRRSTGSVTSKTNSLTGRSTLSAGYASSSSSSAPAKHSSARGARRSKSSQARHQRKASHHRSPPVTRSTSPLMSPADSGNQNMFNGLLQVYASVGSHEAPPSTATTTTTTTTALTGDKQDVDTDLPVHPRRSARYGRSNTSGSDAGGGGGGGGGDSLLSADEVTSDTHSVRSASHSATVWRQRNFGSGGENRRRTMSLSTNASSGGADPNQHLYSGDSASASGGHRKGPGSIRGRAAYRSGTRTDTEQDSDSRPLSTTAWAVASRWADSEDDSTSFSSSVDTYDPHNQPRRKRRLRRHRQRSRAMSHHYDKRSAVSGVPEETGGIPPVIDDTSDTLTDSGGSLEMSVSDLAYYLRQSKQEQAM